MPTTILRPSGDVTKQHARQPVLARNYTAVDEATANDATDYVYNANTTGGLVLLTDVYSLTNLGLSGNNTINSVTLRVRGQSLASGTVRTFRGGLFIGAVQYYGTTLASTTSWTTFSKVWTLSPATGVAFTEAEIDAMGVVVETITNGTVPSPAEARVTWAEVEVDYTPHNTFTASTALITAQAPGAAFTSQIVGYECPGTVTDAQVARTVTSAQVARTVELLAPDSSTIDDEALRSVALVEVARSVTDNRVARTVTDASTARTVEDAC